MSVTCLCFFCVAMCLVGYTGKGMFFLLGAFIAGGLTVLAPCVLPLLPIIIGGSVTGNVRDKKRPLVIAISLAISLLVFTVLLKATSLLINLPPQAINYLSGSIIILLGIVTLFPLLYARLIDWLGIEQWAQRFLGKGYKSKDSLVGPIITGAALGPVFSSCSPVYAYILATVLPANFGQAIEYSIAYVLGLTLLLLLIGHYGQHFVAKIRFASNPHGWFQRTVAILFIAVGLLVFTGYTKQVQTWVSDHTPFNFDSLSAKLLPASEHKTIDNQLYNVQQRFQAPDFQGIDHWVNSSPLTMQQLKGKVVLVDFWTYSCINCIRNNKYLEQWYQAYQKDGLVIVGVHAPEFSFEKVTANVEQGVKAQHITYPVALDNDLATWGAYSNQSWPASYLIDPNGQVVRIHEGEGDYTIEEQAIRQLLADSGAKLGKVVTTTNYVPIVAAQTPETYLGSERASGYQGSPALNPGSTQTFTMPRSLDLGGWALGGTWEDDGEYITARGNSTVAIHVAAKNVYLVAGSDVAADVKVSLGGTPINETSFAGTDVQDGVLHIDGSRLYAVVSFPNFVSNQTLLLTVPNGTRLNTFTFGS